MSTGAFAGKTVAVIGASSDRRKYGNKSLRAHQSQGWQVYPVNPNERDIEGLTCYPAVADIPVDRLDRVTMYVPPHVGIDLLQGIASKRPSEVWLNPGAESPDLVAKAESMGLPIIQACSIVDLGLQPGQFAG